MIRTTVLFIASLAFLSSAAPAGPPRKTPEDLERKLEGAWKGGDCQGDWTFAGGGTFVLRHYTPGKNTLTGRWQVRWDALPPTLILTIKTSDAPDRFKVGETWAVKLVQLDDEAFAFEWPARPRQPLRWTRMKK